MSFTPQISSLRDWLRLICCGLCMGTADIIPGISGGTIAFIMGFYQDLINSIKSLNGLAFQQLFQGKFRLFFNTISWKFLIGLVTGIVIAMVSLAHLVLSILNHELYRIYLYATFFGLIIASSVLCGWQLQRWSLKPFLAFLIAAIVAFFLTGSTISPLPSHDLFDVKLFDTWIILCGALAFSAMILPGISGSYLLTILGVYAPAVAALADFTAGLARGQFDLDSFILLANILIGILLGAIFFTRCISWVLNKYHDIAIAGLTGFMVGALRSVWPFWNYQYTPLPLNLEKGPQLEILDPILPSLMIPETWIAISLALCGAALIFGMHFAAREQQRAKGER